jgi:ATP-dependent Lon protease
MRDVRDAKAMARTLREALRSKAVSVTHSQSLELIAKILGFHDWNVLSGKAQSPKPKADLVMAAQLSNARLPVVPLRDVVLFPETVTPLLLLRDTSRRAVAHALESGDKRILAVSQKQAVDCELVSSALHQVGVTATILDFATMDDGTARPILKCLERASIARWVDQGHFLTADITRIQQSRGHDPRAVVLSRLAVEKFRTFSGVDRSSRIFTRLNHVCDPASVADIIIPALSDDLKQSQDLLETSDVIIRLRKILSLMEADTQAAAEPCAARAQQRKTSNNSAAANRSS